MCVDTHHLLPQRDRHGRIRDHGRGHIRERDATAHGQAMAPTTLLPLEQRRSRRRCAPADGGDGQSRRLRRLRRRDRRTRLAVAFSTPLLTVSSPASPIRPTSGDVNVHQGMVQRGDARAPEEQRIADGDACHRVGGVCELVARAARYPRRIPARSTCAADRLRRSRRRRMPRQRRLVEGRPPWGFVRLPPAGHPRSIPPVEVEKRSSTRRTPFT